MGQAYKARYHQALYVYGSLIQRAPLPFLLLPLAASLASIAAFFFGIPMDHNLQTRPFSHPPAPT